MVPVVRASSGEEAMQVIEAIREGGVPVLEITMTVPRAVRVIEQVADRYGSEVVVGAGTVLDPETARACILAGASFIVSPALNAATIDLCRRYSVAVMPGALTPTEVLTAWQAGADVVKVFPCGALGGAKYLKSLKAPLPQIEMTRPAASRSRPRPSSSRRGRSRSASVPTSWTRRPSAPARPRR